MYKNQELYKLGIISLILVTLMFDSRVMLQGEIRSWSLVGVKGLKIIPESRIDEMIVQQILRVHT